MVHHITMDTNNRRSGKIVLRKATCVAPSPIKRKKKPRKSKTSPTTVYLELICATLKDVACTCYQSELELQHDLATLRNRFANEGMPFLTKTLPSFGKAIDKALATDTPLEVVGFKTNGTVLPLFMGECTRQVFDTDGRERSDASPQALKALRQLSYMFYKLELPFTKEQNNDVIKLFKETDANLPAFDAAIRSDSEGYIRRARDLICRILAPVDPRDPDLFRPRHGSGAVATREKAYEKPCFKRYYKALALEFPYEDWFFYNTAHLVDELDQFLAADELDSGTAKVMLVPKDSRGPRLISCEPLEYMWIQQGLMATLVQTIESHPLTRGKVGFTDQTVNRRLALAASLDGGMATLDMKEASDRVSTELVKALFPETWVRALLAARSDATELPDGEVFQMKKFAPMGSATCFPVESLVFWALSVAVITYGVQSPDSRREAQQSVYVYGDDIICRSEDQAMIRQQLPKFGLLFNEGKCCVGRFFRESCGCDAYKGVDVTPLKIKTTWCESLADISYVSWVAYHNALNELGLFDACDYLASVIQKDRVTPYADGPGSEVVALVDCRKMAITQNKLLNIQSRTKRSSNSKNDYCQYEVKALVVHPCVLKDTAVPGWSEMLRLASYSTESSSGDATKVLKTLSSVMEEKARDRKSVV